MLNDGVAVVVVVAKQWFTFKEIIFYIPGILGLKPLGSYKVYSACHTSEVNLVKDLHLWDSWTLSIRKYQNIKKINATNRTHLFKSVANNLTI